MCCREKYTKLEGGAIAIGVIHIVFCTYFFVFGIGQQVINIDDKQWDFAYHTFVKTVFLSEAVFGWAFSTTLLIGITKGNPNCYLSYIVWVCLSHFVINTIFLIATMLLSSSTCLSRCRRSVAPDDDEMKRGVRELYIYTCVAYYLLGTVSLIIIYKQFRILKDRIKSLQSDIDVRYTLQYH